MRISRARSLFDNQPTTLTGEWEEIAQALAKAPDASCTLLTCPSFQPGPDKCQARGFRGMWGPAVFDGVPDLKTGGWKSLPHMTAMDLLVFDVDDLHRADLATIDAAIQANQLECVMYSTHSCDVAGDSLGLRFVFPLTQPITVDRRGRRFDEKLRAWRDRWAKKLSIPFDPATVDESRLYFLPDKPQGARFIYSRLRGQFIDTAAYASEAMPTRGGVDSSAAGAAVIGSDAAPAPVFNEPVDMAELRAKAHAIGGDYRPLIRRAIKGEAIVPDDGMRDVNLNNTISALAFGLPFGTPAEAILELIRPALNHWTLRNRSDGRTWLGQAEHQLLRALERRAIREAEERAKRAADDAMRAELGIGVRERNPDATPEEIAQAVADGKEQAKYTDEELQAFYLKAGVSDEVGFRPYWVMRNNGANWLWVDGQYQRPIKDVDLDYALRRDLSRSPIQLFDTDPKTGEISPRKASDILAYYSTVANGGVKGSLADQESWYDPETKTFHEAVCPMRKLEPRFDNQIDEWLRLLGNEQVLDWVAAVSQLGYQCAALYIKSEGGIGKTLLANGLARIWHTGGATPFSDVVGSTFNSALTDCPLIFADEALPKNDSIVDTIRQLLGTTDRSLNRKFMPTVNVSGSPRLLIAGNNEHIIHTSARLEASDVDAIAQRILFVDLTGNYAPKNYLEGLKQTHGSELISKGWLDGSLIARHALWLRDNRKLNTNNRFLVTGDKEFADRLATTSGHVPAVMEFLGRYLSADASAQPNAYLKVGAGRLLVNTELLANKGMFERFVPSRRVLAAKDISQALRQVSTKTDSVDGREFFDLKVELFLGWCKSNQVGDLAALRKAIGVDQN